tara:strand:+ start:3117 stop:4178 length:1062 start_codon:yes stop_codon:yes gene_type:complete
MIKLKQIITESIKLPADKIIVLQADTDEHKRGLVVKWRSDGGYDVAYWYDTPDNIVAAEVRTAEELPDGKWEEHGEGLGDYKHVWLGYHPKLDERLKKGESGCCHKCGWSHVKGSAHKTPYKSGKNSCANRKSESLSEGCGCGCNTCVDENVAKNHDGKAAPYGSGYKKVKENFIDGKKPGRKGISKRVGIPKGASISQLEKLAKSDGEKGRMARWQLNMKRGKKKANEGKKKGIDGKACWDGYRHTGTKDGKDVCVKVNEYNLIEYLKKQTIQEGEYEGRDVKLNKPMQGDVKKFKVYVKNSKGNVVKVNFGQKGMVIKKDNPGARKSFRARHKCDQKKDKTTAGYWSCKKW